MRLKLFVASGMSMEPEDSENNIFDRKVIKRVSYTWSVKCASVVQIVRQKQDD